jgi:nitroreductase
VCASPREYLARIDTFLAIASRREGRSYAQRPLKDDVRTRILDAGRLAGNSQNRQQWRFYVVDERALLEQVAEHVYAPSNLLGAAFVVAITMHGKGPTSFDAGRAAQNMLLAAWNDGVVGTPNGIKDADRVAELLQVVEEGERPAIILSFGYPDPPRDPERRTAREWVARANRKPLDELVRYR